ncbi:MAG: hypothetical protein NC402_05635 [Prevotella sp.]|nr:hypothetical protein [Prevotella sp.]MCM1074567.1 hypothetical protein [Ruminococcus sp.]
MKKVILSLAVLASVALVSCSKGEAKNDSESAAAATENVEGTECDSACEKACTETNAATEVAPAVEDAPVDTTAVKA